VEPSWVLELWFIDSWVITLNLNSKPYMILYETPTCIRTGLHWSKLPEQKQGVWPPTPLWYHHFKCLQLACWNKFFDVVKLVHLPDQGEPFIFVLWENKYKRNQQSKDRTKKARRSVSLVCNCHHCTSSC
jgi:hypothetical protein